MSPHADDCANEPVQNIGHIQPHGLLFAASEPDLIVHHASANVATLLGIPVEDVLGHSLQVVLGESQFEAFRQILGRDPLSRNPVRVVVGGRALEMDCLAHRQNAGQDTMLIVELELVEGARSVHPLNLDTHVRTPLSGMAAASGILELSQTAAAEVRRLTGFDRVMVYRFDGEWNGEVIAEAVGPSPVSYLGLRFPASDIPAQVRRLFSINPLRAIVDVAAVAVPIVCSNGPQQGIPLDLTLSSLRSAAPIHLEYMRNMQVESSMTVSILVQDRLWGMIACHHSLPHRLDCSARSLCELIGQMLASQIAFRLDNAVLQSRLESRKSLEKYMAGIESSRSVFDAELFQSPQILELLDADGLISRIDGVVASYGIALPESSLLRVIGKLRNLSTRGVASSNMLATVDPGVASCASEVSGALYLGLTAAVVPMIAHADEEFLDRGKGDYLLLLRRELLETVVWAGNPDKAVSADEQGRIQPRNSFAAWQQTVRGRSRPWSELELESASILREQLLRLREAQRLHESQERVRFLAHHDALTGLINRHTIHLKLQQCVQHAMANDSCFAVLFIDLDHFKHFNDSLGHAVGDEILKMVSKRLLHQVRTQDYVGRLGGDEFIVILNGLHLQGQVFEVIARILRSIEEPFGIEKDTDIRITASIGLSRFPVDGIRSDELINRSDLAMYRAKRNGGNSFFEHFEEGSQRSSEQRA